MKFFDLFSKRKLILCGVQIVLVAMAIITASHSATRECRIKYEARLAEMSAKYEQELSKLTASADNGLFLSTRLSGDHRIEAEALARLIQGTIPNHPDSSKEALCWLVFNRMENPLFPDTVLGVLTQDGQFDTYNAETVITEANYTIAHNELSKYYNGDFRPVAPGFVYLTCGSTDITLRDNWDAKKAHEWRS